MSPAPCGFSRVAVTGFITLLIPTIGLGQDQRGTIGGRVVDRSDVIGAKVQVTNVETKVAATIQSNHTGSVGVPFLIPGTYRVSAEMPGFKTATLENIELRVADTLAPPNTTPNQLGLRDGDQFGIRAQEHRLLLQGGLLIPQRTFQG